MLIYFSIWAWVYQGQIKIKINRGKRLQNKIISRTTLIWIPVIAPSACQPNTQILFFSDDKKWDGDVLDYKRLALFPWSLI